MKWTLFLLSVALSMEGLAQTTTTLVPLQSVWKYLDNGSNQGTAWQAPAFNDSAWAQGAAELGYGDGDEATVVSYGPSTSARYITTYFRRHFTVTNASSFTSANLRVRRDDGVVIYLNGTEVYRNTMPTGTVTYTTLASAAVTDEVSLFPSAVSAALLVNGDNVLAVEIHQASATSSDISFDMDFTATAPAAGIPVANAQAVTLNEDTPTAITLTGSDPENSPLTYSIVTAPSKGTLVGASPTVTYTPNANVSGADSFTFKVNDGTYNSPSATVSLTVTAVNDAPVGNSQSVTAVNGDPVTVTLSGSDVESRFGTLADYTQQFYSGDLTTITDGLSGATWNANTGTLFLIRNVSTGAGHSYEYNADGTWVRTITQSGFQDTEAIAWMYGNTYAIAEENDFQRITICTIAPGVTTLDRTAAGNVTWNTVVGSLLNFGIECMCYDAGRNLIYYLAEKPAGGTWNIYTMNPATGVSSVLCDLNASIGTAAVATDLSDMAFDRATDTILLLSHESSKIIRVSRAGVVLEQRGFTTAFTQAEALALTPDRGRLFVGGEPKQFARYALPLDTLTYILATPPLHGAISGLPPTVTYTPDAGYQGPDSFTFTLSDGSLTSAPATVTLTVPPFNLPPVADNQSLSLDEDTSAAVVLGASDPENAPLIWTVLTSPAHGVLTGTAPNLTYTPVANYFGADSFTFRVNDGGRNSNTATVTFSITNVQDAPIALPGTGSIEATYPLGLTLAGSDADGQALTYVIASAPSHGTLTGVPPSVTYTTPIDYAGPDSFTFTVSDGIATSAAATVSITVAPFNLPPVAQSSSRTTAEDTAVSVTLSASDPESSPLTYAITVPPAKGTLSGTAPNLTYTPLANANGSDSFTWTANDGGKASAPAVVSITITPVNDAPVAQSLSIPVERDTPGVVTLAGTDAENSPLTFTVLTQPGHGTLTGTAPALNFAPAAGYTGADAFTYKVNDGSLDSAVATVNLTVTAAALDTLVAAGAVWKYLDNGSNQGTAWRASSFDDSTWLSGPAQLGYGDGDEAKVIGYGPDVNNRYVTTYFRREFQLPNPGIITAALKLDLLRDDGAVVYLNGTEIVRSNMPTGTVAYNTLASSSISAPAESTFYTSALSSSLLLSGRNVLAVEVHQGALNSADVSFDLKLYEAQPAFTRGPYVQMTGTDRATVRWRTDVATTSKLDYGLSTAVLNSTSSTATLKTEHEVTVTGLTPNTRYYYAAGNSSGVLASGATNYFTTHPPVGTVQPYRFWVLGDPGTGTASQSAVRDAFYTWNGAQQLAGVLLLGDTVYDTGTDLEFQTKFFDFYPATLRNTTMWPTFGNHDAGSASSATQTGPYYDSFTMPKFGEAGGVASGTEAYYSFDIGNIHFISLDSQGTSLLSTGNMAAWLEQDLSATTQEWIVAFWHHPSYSKGSHDSDVATADGGRMKDMREVFVPILENHGVDLVLFGHEHNYQRSKFIDGHYGVSTTFNSATMVKQAGLGNPAVDGAYTKGDGPHKGAVFTVAGSAGQVTVATLNHAAMAVNYAELGSVVLDVNGRDLVARFLNSTGAIRDTFSIVHNSAPVAAAATLTGNEDASLPVTLAASDADSDALTWEIVTPPAVGTLSGTAPSLTFTPPANFNGTANLQFRVNDGRVNSATVTVTLNITPVNDVPIAITQSVTAAEDSLAVITLAGTDVESSALTFAFTALPAHGMLTGVLPLVTYIPDVNWSGADSFAFTVSDGSAVSAPAIVALTVTPVNDAPVAAAVRVNTDEDSAAAVTLSAADIEGDALTFAVVSQPGHGLLSGTAPNLTYTPDANWSGEDAFTFVASDGQVNSVPGIATVTVAPVNDLPHAVAQFVAIAEDTAAGITLAASDADGDTLAYFVTVPPLHGTLAGTAPDLIYSPGTDWNGTESFEFTVSDGTGTSAPAAVTITVTPVNDVPLPGTQSLETNEDAALPVVLTGSDSEDDSLSFALTVQPLHGALSGTLPNLVYTPAADFHGSDSFKFTVADGTAVSGEAMITISVLPVNDSPLAAEMTVTTGEDTAADITLSAADVDGDALAFAVVTPPAHGTLSGTAPSLIYTPEADWHGSDTIVFAVSDGTSTSAPAAVSITVTPVNDAPVASAQAITTSEDTPIALTLAGTDSDGDILTYAITMPPQHGALSGTLPDVTYTPDPDWNGDDSFAFTASDAVGAYLLATVSVAVTSVNDVPVAVAHAISTAEDTLLPVTLNGTDEERETLTFVITVPPVHGTLSGTPPSLTYTPDPDWHGIDTFSFTAGDGSSVSAAAAVSITVTAVNDAPLAVSQSLACDEDVPLSVTLTGSDVDSDVLIFAVTVPPSHGSLSGTAPDLIYTPGADFHGTDSFSFTATDGSALSAETVIALTVSSVNDLPVASASVVVTGEDTAVPVPLLAIDADGDDLVFTVLTAPAHGTLSGAATALTYNPDANWHGTDAFTWGVNDGAVDSLPVSAVISVTPVNDVPVAAALALATVEDISVNITLAGSDADGEPLSYTIVSSPAHGTLSGTAPELSYAPDADYNGADSFTYVVNDGQSDSAAAVVEISITAANDTPVAAAQSLSGAEDSIVSAVLAGTDAEGDALTYSVTSLPAHGSLAGVLPAVTFIPDADWNGADSFAFTVSDGSAVSAPAIVSLTVTPVNDAPVAADVTVTADEDSAAAIVLSVSDIEGDALALTVVTQPAHGTLSGTAPTLTYTPEANWHGQDSFTFVASDGVADSVPGIVSITLTPVNDAPVASGQSVAIDEDTPAGITLAATDADGDVLVYTVTVPPGHGTLSGVAPELTYTPAADWNGADSFEFTVSDGTASSASAVVAMVVTPVNDVPLAAAQSLITDEDTALLLTLTGSDADADVLTFAIAATPVHGALSGTGPDLIYTPAAGWNGADSFSFTVSDGAGASAPAVVDVVVAAINDAPLVAAQTVASDEDAAVSIALAGTDGDGDALTFTILTPPAHGELSGAAPDLVYTPDANWNGEDGFTFGVSDGILSSGPAAVAVSVSPVNDVPVAADLALSAAEDTAQPVILSGADADGDALIWQITLPPSHGALSGTAPALTYTPDPDWNGGDSFNYTASDALAASAPSTVLLTITAVNDAPVAGGQALTTAEDTALMLALAGTDTEGTALTYTVTAPPAHGTLAGVLPEVSYIPAGDWSGADSFTFIVSDGTDTSAPAVVAVTVTPVNDVPVASSAAVTTEEDTASAVHLSAADVEGDTLAYTIVTPPAHGTLSGAAPDLVYTPEANWDGSDSFTFVASDGAGDSLPATVSITVTPVNDTPLAAAQSLTVAEDTALPLLLAGGDIENETLNFTVTGAPAHGTLSGAAPDLTYTPDANWNGADSFTFTVSDGTATSAPAAVGITVTAGNDVPLAAAQTKVTDEDAALSITLGGSDVDGDALTFTVTVLPAHGTLSGSAPDLIYTPEANWNGADAFTWTVSDALSVSAPVTVSLTVTAVNDAPVAVAQTLSTAEDDPLALLLTGTDLDGDSLAYTVTASPVHGTLAGVLPEVTYIPDHDWNGTDSFAFTVNDGSVGSSAAVVAITVTPVNDPPVTAPVGVTTEEDTAAAVILTATDIEGDLLSFSVAAAPDHGTLSGTAPDLVYTPDAGWHGEDSFTFFASDAQESSIPGIATITVRSVNDVPFAAPLSLVVAEDGTVPVTLGGNDSDGDIISFTVTIAPAHGALSGIAPDLVYTPEPNWSGADSFAYIVSDAASFSTPAVVSISITPVNDVPVAIAQAIVSFEDTAVPVILSAVDADSDGLTYAVTSPPAHGSLGGTAPDLTYTPGNNWNGSDSFSFNVSDGTAVSASVTVTLEITPVNDSPLAIPQSITTAEDVPSAITLAGSDADGDTLAFTVVVPPAHGSLSGTAPNLIYTPAANWHGADVLSFTVSDGTVTSIPSAVSFIVTPVNDPPLAAARTTSTNEDVALPLVLAGSDADADALTFIVTVPPAHGTLSGTPPNLTYTPEGNWNGPDSFTFITSDGVANSLPAIFAINVNPVNDAPVAVAQTLSTAEDVPLAIILSGTDIDQDSLTIAVTAPPTQGSLSGTAGSRTYTPAADWSGSDSFSFTVSDGTATSASVSVSIAVTPVNDAPVATPVSVTTDVGVPVAVILTGSDVEGSPLIWNVTVPPSFGTLSGSGGSRSYSPNLAWSGTDQFAFTVSDGTATSVATTATITVASSGAWQLVARTGHPAPGAGGVTFSIFQPDYVSDAVGRASFRAAAGSITGIWTEGASGLEAVVVQAAAAPGAAGAVFDAVATGPWAAGDGELLVFGKLLAGTGGVTTSNDLGYWRRGGGVTSLIAREDGVVPGMASAARFSVLSAVATLEAGGNYAYAATMKTNSSLGITSANDTGLWATFGVPARLLVRENSVAPGSTDGGLFDTLTTAGLVSNGAGQVGFASALKVAGSVTTANRNGLWMWDPAQFGLVARGGNAAPGTPAGAVFAQPLNPAFGDGAMTFRSTLSAGGGVTTSNDTGLWILEGGTVGLLAREGFQASGVPTGGLFNGFTEGASMNSGNELAFRTALRTGSGVTSANNAGLWVRSRFTANSLSLVARKGTAAPGTGTATFSSFDYPFVADDGGEVFTAALTVSTATGVTAANDRGLWVRTATGSLALGLREGTAFTLAPGDVRTVANITLPATRSSGRSPLSDDSRLLVLLSFTDGSTALYHYTLP